MKEQFQINEEVLWDYADGLLPSAAAQAVESALAGSVELQKAYEKVQAEKLILISIPSEVVPRNLSKNIMASWGTEQEQVQLRQAQTDTLTKLIFGFLGGLLCFTVGVFFYALLKQSALEFKLFEYTPTNTGWATQPSYLLSMFFISLLFAIFALERGFDRENWAMA